MKILYITTIGSTMCFFKDLIRELTEEGHRVDIACSHTEMIPECYEEYGCKAYEISCSRSPLSPGNVKAIGQIKKLVKENGYDIVHCHTPVAAACTRFACKGLRGRGGSGANEADTGLRVFYTAHGFHFYTGAPLKNWMVFYPIEKLCSKWTDVLVTINKEDFARAKEKFCAKEVRYVPGVGIDVDSFYEDASSREVRRIKMGIPEGARLFVTVGELIPRKNQGVLIEAISQMEKKPYLFIVGKGPLKEQYEARVAELGLSEHIRLLGQRSDVKELLNMADAFVFPSHQEGLPVALMEAMSCGVYCIASDIRGNEDLIDKDKLLPCTDVDAWKCAMEETVKEIPYVDYAPVLKPYKLTNVIAQMKSLYGLS